MISTVADFIVKYIDNQYIRVDGAEIKYVEGMFTIFGHGNVLGIGQSLEFVDHKLNVIQGKNEQGMALAAMGYAKESNRNSIYAVTTSIGPGCTNLVTAAACATVNRIPLLLFPGDSFESRQPDPVLQQLENINSASITVTESLKPVSKYYDRISHPEQVFSILEKAFATLTSPEKTGAVTIALPQDIQTEIIEYDESLVAKKIWEVKRCIPSQEELEYIYNEINNHEKVVFLCGGGVRYSDAGKELNLVAKKLNIPIVETQAGKSTVINSELVLGGVGVTGTSAANKAIEECDLVVSFGSRLNDFTSQSSSFAKSKKLINVNIGHLDQIKQNGHPINADIKLTLLGLSELIKEQDTPKSNFYLKHKWEWEETVKLLQEQGNLIGNDSDVHIDKFKEKYPIALNQTQTVLSLNSIIEEDAIVVTASGSLPGDLQRIWEPKQPNSYHVEYGYSCMGYEICAAIGVKLAKPDKPVYVFVGDGSFNMLHSEILTSLQYNIPINILLFDNSGFGCINNLQKEYGSNGYRTEFKTLENDIEADFTTCDYAQIALGYGAESTTINVLDELQSVANAQKTKLFDIKVYPKTMTAGYSSWWDVGFDRENKTELQDKMFEKLQTERKLRNGTNKRDNK